ncbi:zf-DHHC-domain-containing protein [Auriculariales sp. MPI-PUGE-AT-0066]|nr:zf-DHHC-domain-containing protein [Auriculariales sp. MPI-PUGE-AT-0066]
MVSRLWGRVWVGFTTSLIAFIAYTSQIFVIWPWYGRTFSAELFQMLVPFNILVGILYYNYYLCVKTDPGRVPEGWRPDLSSGEQFEVKRFIGTPRYCTKCDQYKPPRAHHCSQCKRCVLKMDHHCPWVNNCVGHRNHGHFLRFLFFVDLACSYHLWMMVRRALDVAYTGEPEVVEIVFMVLNFTACIPVILCVGLFSLYHFYLLATNTTSIEGMEKDKVATLVKRGKIRSVKFPYSISVLENIRSVLGPVSLLWCWPTEQVQGSGVRFFVSDGVEDTVQDVWPPVDPSRRQIDYGASDDDAPVKLPESGPWTYGEGSFNPTLKPSSQELRQRSRYPPYHPMYGKEAGSDAGDDSSSDDVSDHEEVGLRRRVRRGSEGFEVRQISRDDMLRPYLPSEAAARNFDMSPRRANYDSDGRAHSDNEGRYDGGSVV